MKQYHILLMTCELPGDGVITFYKTAKKLKKEFDKIVNPMLAVCEKEKLTEDEEYSFVRHWDVKHNTTVQNLFGVRFNAQENEKLDALMPVNNEVNNYIQMVTIDVPEHYTHYVVTFSQYVDESVMTLHPEQEAREYYERTVVNAISGTDVDREDPDTWENDYSDEEEDDGAIFRENKERTEFYDTNGDPYTCTRLVELPKVN